MEQKPIFVSAVMLMLIIAGWLFLPEFFSYPVEKENPLQVGALEAYVQSHFDVIAEVHRQNPDFWAPLAVPPISPQQGIEVAQRFMDVLETLPDQEVRDALMTQITDVNILFVVTQEPVLMAFNPVFKALFVDYDLMQGGEEYKGFQWAVLVHEGQHILDYLAGELTIADATCAGLSERECALRYWEMEERAEVREAKFRLIYDQQRMEQQGFGPEKVRFELTALKHIADNIASASITPVHRKYFPDYLRKRIAELGEPPQTFALITSK